MRLGLLETGPAINPVPETPPVPQQCASFAAVLGDITERACIYRDATIVTLCDLTFGTHTLPIAC